MKVKNLGDVLEHLGLDKLKPTSVQVMTGAKITELVRQAYHFGFSIAVGERKNEEVNDA